MLFLSSYCHGRHTMACYYGHFKQRASVAGTRSCYPVLLLVNMGICPSSVALVRHPFTNKSPKLLTTLVSQGAVNQRDALVIVEQHVPWTCFCYRNTGKHWSNSLTLSSAPASNRVDVQLAPGKGKTANWKEGKRDCVRIRKARDTSEASIHSKCRLAHRAFLQRPCKRKLHESHIGQCCLSIKLHEASSMKLDATSLQRLSIPGASATHRARSVSAPGPCVAKKWVMPWWNTETCKGRTKRFTDAVHALLPQGLRFRLSRAHRMKPSVNEARTVKKLRQGGLHHSVPRMLEVVVVMPGSAPTAKPL